MSDVASLKVQLQAVETEIFNEYQRFHKQDPTVRPVEAGRLGALWRVFDECVHELKLLGETV